MDVRLLLAAADTKWDDQSQGVLLRFAPACLLLALGILVVIAGGIVLAKVLHNRNRRL